MMYSDLSKSNVAEESGMLIGKIEHRSLTVDEVFKQWCLIALSCGVDEETGFSIIGPTTSLSAAFLASQATPTMAHLSTYIWTRIVTESVLKVSGKWKTVKTMGYDGMQEIMRAVSTPLVFFSQGDVFPLPFFEALPVAIQPGSIRAWFPATGIRVLDRSFRNRWHITWLAI